MHNYLAIDLGAESGRLILGRIEHGYLSLRELHRFPTGMIRVNGHYHWNIGSIYAEIIKGIGICFRDEKIVPESIGIDTWGVDYALLAEDGSLMGLLFAYRDSRTEHSINEFSKLVSIADLYAATGNMPVSYNTLFQLSAAKKHHPKLLESATSLLFIPDLIAYFLTGEKKTEFSFATTSQLFNRKQNAWDTRVFNALGINPGIMQPVVEAGSVIGTLTPDVMQMTGAPALPVVAVATHDTASAIAAIPAGDEHWAFISSGTWSLMGVETGAPILTDEALGNNLTNEGGAGRKNYLLKNLTGLWILQQFRKTMDSRDTGYPELVQAAGDASAFYAFIDTDDSSFMNPRDMKAAINQYLEGTGQVVPRTTGQYVRVILESLCLKYRHTLEQLRKIRPVELLYITGGGVRNELLCQFTANSCGIPVTTVWAEGTAAGNVMVQALAMGGVNSEEECRAVLSASCEPRTYYPQHQQEWNDAFSKYLLITQNENR